MNDGGERSTDETENIESTRTDNHGRPVNGTNTLFCFLTDVGLLQSHVQYRFFFFDFPEALLSLAARHPSRKFTMLNLGERRVGYRSLWPEQFVFLSSLFKSSHGPHFVYIYPQCFALSRPLCLLSSS